MGLPWRSLNTTAGVRPLTTGPFRIPWTRTTSVQFPGPAPAVGSAASTVATHTFVACPTRSASDLGPGHAAATGWASAGANGTTLGMLDRARTARIERRPARRRRLGLVLPVEDLRDALVFEHRLKGIGDDRRDGQHGQPVSQNLQLLVRDGEAVRDDSLLDRGLR